MDSITHLFLGGAVAAAIAPAKYRRAALLAGAALNTLPDLDSLFIALSTSDPVSLIQAMPPLSMSMSMMACPVARPRRFA